MTKKLYELDSYMSEFQASILSCEKENNCYAIILNQTAFFPEGGGQKSDIGHIGNIEVFDVQIINGIIYHYTNESIPVGGTVDCKIDFSWRFRNMQHHTGEHIFSGIIYKLYELENIGFHLGDTGITADYDGFLTEEQILEAEKLANNAIYDNSEIKIGIFSPEELKDTSYRSKKEISQNIRIVEIPNIDRCACCAPHVKRTGEVGIIKVSEITTHNKHIRIKIHCANEALEYINIVQSNLLNISRSISAQYNNAYEVFKKTMSDYANCKHKLYLSNKKYAILKANEIPKTDGNFCFYTEDADIETLRTITNNMLNKVSGISMALSGDDEKGYVFVGASVAYNMNETAKLLRSTLNAKCGGSDKMIQGSIFNTKEKINKFFKKSSL